MTSKNTIKLLVALVASGLAACASAVPPQAKLTLTAASIRAAEELKAAEVPQAQLHLKLAQDQLLQAEKLIEESEMERAERVLVRANADAELALELAKEVETVKAAERAQAQIRSLQSK